MRMVDIINKKKRGLELNSVEIKNVIEAYTKGNIPDYQMSAFLMAVYFKGLTDKELTDMTVSMRDSGDIIDLSAIKGIKVDKHSTGGVGDKTTLVVAPVVAACGGHVAKMSGRGLGFTGGTIDKLESIPGFRTDIKMNEFIDNVNKIGVSIMGQTADIATADKKIYALRDVTGTVDSIPLIASSIMSKKLASGSDKIILDVTVGSGAFMKDIDLAKDLAEKMVRIGNNAGKETIAVITNMDEPLGNCVGNIIEVKEAIETLKGQGPADFNEICREFSAYMLAACGCADLDKARIMADEAIKNGKGLEKFEELVEAQGGDRSYIEHPEKFKQPEYSLRVMADRDGYIYHMNTEACGIAASVAGAGREKTDSRIDATAGIKFIKKTGDPVKAGETIAIIYTSATGIENSETVLKNASDILKDAIEIRENKPVKQKIIIDVVKQQ